MTPLEIDYLIGYFDTNRKYIIEACLLDTDKFIMYKDFYTKKERDLQFKDLKSDWFLYRKRDLK